jgi:hypothetical protein
MPGEEEEEEHISNYKCSGKLDIKNSPSEMLYRLILEYFN